MELVIAVNCGGRPKISFYVVHDCVSSTFFMVSPISAGLGAMVAPAAARAAILS